MADKRSSGSGSTGGAGSGYQVEVDSLRAFAGQVRGLLAEFQASADGPTTHARTGVGGTSFGEFAEAKALHDQYELMRDGLRDVLSALHEAIDDAQRKADLTATNYEEQEHRTAQTLKVSSDGWSVSTATPAPITYGAGAAGVVAGAVAGRSAAKPAGRTAVKDTAAEAPQEPPAVTPGEVPGEAPGAVPGAVAPGGGVPGAAGKGNSTRPGVTDENGDGDGGPVEQPTW
ncbi:hypothetical protein [Kitasatospora sp. NBC_01302]|uniref:hypothetical protein n=1 Tax=Kitasatospora sp. NBC_01302 TaxID=2903575 RepID=UPI002E0D25AB|nr:hypothetical protein OG294_15780 [Kitasatospora sp. NBC_01302]